MPMCDWSSDVCSSDLMENCPENLTPVYDKLKRGEHEIAEIQKTGITCDVSQQRNVISKDRIELKEIENLRNEVRAKVLLAKGALNAQGHNKATAVAQAKKDLEKAVNLLKNKRKECYDNLNQQIDVLTAGLGAIVVPGVNLTDLPIDSDPGDDGVPPDIETIPEDLPGDSGGSGGSSNVGTHWVLESAVVTPDRPDPGWGFGGPRASGAQFKLSNGDTAIFSWTPAPDQIDAGGFTISMTANGSPADPRGRIAVLIQVSAPGCDANIPSDQMSAYGTADAGPTSASKSVTFKPQPSASEIEIRIGLMWGGLNFTYKYRRAS